MSNQITLTVTLSRSQPGLIDVSLNREGEGDDIVSLRADDFERSIRNTFTELKRHGYEVKQS